MSNPLTRRVNLSSPGVQGVALTAAMMSDTVDLTDAAKAVTFYNGSNAAIVIKFLPAKGDTALIETLPPGTRGSIPVTMRRIYSTGSTGLSTALTAGTCTVNLWTD